MVKVALIRSSAIFCMALIRAGCCSTYDADAAAVVRLLLDTLPARAAKIIKVEYAQKTLVEQAILFSHLLVKLLLKLGEMVCPSDFAETILVLYRTLITELLIARLTDLNRLYVWKNCMIVGHACPINIYKYSWFSFLEYIQESFHYLK